MARARKPDGELDRELDDLPAPARWREWMGRVEAAIFASAEPVLRENLARVVGKACNLELIIDDIREELRGRPYEIVFEDRVKPPWAATAADAARLHIENDQPV